MNRKEKKKHWETASGLVKEWADEQVLYQSFDAPPYVMQIAQLSAKAVARERKRCKRIVDFCIKNNFDGHMLKKNIIRMIQRGRELNKSEAKSRKISEAS